MKNNEISQLVIYIYFCALCVRELTGLWRVDALLLGGVQRATAVTGGEKKSNITEQHNVYVITGSSSSLRVINLVNSVVYFYLFGSLSAFMLS